MMPSNLGYSIREAFAHIRRNWSTCLGAIVTIFLSLFVIGVFALGSNLVGNLVGNVEDRVTIQAFLADSADQGKVESYQKKIEGMEPVLRHVGVMRILNDKFRIGCNFGKKCKIDRLYDEQRHVIFDDWKKRYNRSFLTASMKNKRKTTMQKAKTVLSLGVALLHYLLCSYHSG